MKIRWNEQKRLWFVDLPNGVRVYTHRSDQAEAIYKASAEDAPVARWKWGMAGEQGQHVGGRALQQAQPALVHQPDPVRHRVDHQAGRQDAMKAGDTVVCRGSRGYLFTTGKEYTVQDYQPGRTTSTSHGPLTCRSSTTMARRSGAMRTASP
ncbi:hypothetical protein IVIADoCa4_20 [Xanthomonas phage vB_Xar_IVIA-DoCa4]|uniref:Uncharacterized protein n=1 Tax=Xanthomonas phage vB_Xar_IVIA-DoCa4 TaxID=2975531 RepID=A0A9X9JMN8_9CAUD|nr:hypothetical protein IVIADoCa4_20 [Xanthomonas phage vB_Xar_IVIA-DoCa4]